MLEFKNGDDVFFFDSDTNTLSDEKGNVIRLSEGILGEIPPDNLSLFISELFKRIYESINDFEEICKSDKGLNIVWEKPDQAHF